MQNDNRGERMKAVIITRPGGPEVLRIEERPTPMPGPMELRVRVHASALNRADLLQRRGSYPPPPGFPADIPGLEYAGEVESVGSGVTRFAVGDRVMGIVSGGAQAEFVCVDEGEAVSVPQGMGWANAAAIPEAFMTAYDALVPLAGMKDGETVLVHAAASGVGTAAIQLAKSFGGNTFGTSRTPGKLAEIASLGLDHPIDASGNDWPGAVAAIAGREGIDVILDLVGGGDHLPNIRLAAPGGRIVVIGLVGGARAETNLGLLLAKRLRLIGTVMRGRPLAEKVALAQEFAAVVVPLFEAGKLRPVVDRVLPFDQIAEGHQLLEGNTTVGKVIVTW
jgi:putative PIG3 family NAD(P)H quinone oxidoreductase